MLRNSEHTYGQVAIVLHWGMAIAIFAMFALGLWMVDLSYYDAWYHRAPALHKAIGILLLITLLFRLIWRLTNPVPHIMGPSWERCAALAVHRMHYVLLFALMLSGYLIPTAKGAGIDVFGWFTVPATLSFDRQAADMIGDLHRWLAWSAIGLAAMHTLAALKHHFIDRDATLTRMLGMQHTRRIT